MEIIKKRNLTIFYYTNIEDLDSEKETFSRLEIKLDLVGKKNPIKVCPRNEEFNILLLNTGNKNLDFKNLREKLDKISLGYILD